MSADTEGDRERERLLLLLDAAGEKSGKIRFWWRDDDAADATPQLDRLLDLARQFDLPLALAVIPKDATPALAARLATEPRVFVLQHGWSHARHSPETEKKMELGAHRPLAKILGELGMGRERLARLFPEKFLPVLVPPWNRIADSVRSARQTVGLAGLSTFGPAPAGEPDWVNTHLDIIDWTTRGPLRRRNAYALLCREIERRLDGEPEPVGIMTHHLVHEEGSWAFLDELFAPLARHPAVSWPDTAELFGVRPAGRVGKA